MAAPDFRLPAKWIEYNVQKKECAAFIPEDETEQVCQCGRLRRDHYEDVRSYRYDRNLFWKPGLHTKSYPTDAYGSILFEGEVHQNKAPYVRVAYDTRPELVIQLMTLVWGLPLPKLVMSVRGGGSNFKIRSSLGKALQQGLIEAAKATQAWIFTNGINKGVAKQVGNLLSNQRLMGFKRGQVISVGISTWGIVEHRKELIGRDHERNYSMLEHTDSKFVPLNPRHSNFLLVDNGSVGKWGKESFFRKRLLTYLSNFPTSASRGCDTPVVGIVLEGGLTTLKMIEEFLYHDPPVPIVIVYDTGRTADFITHILRRTSQGQDLNSLKEEICYGISRIYQVSGTQIATIYTEIKKIYAKRYMITVYDEKLGDFDKILLGAIFRSQHWSPLQQLFLTLVWDRVDIAIDEVFEYGREWSRTHLEHAMMEALATNRLRFVQLLLEHGLNMQTFLTPARLETLYSSGKTQSKLMRTLVSEFVRLRTTRRRYGREKNLLEPSLSLRDIGVVLGRILGHVYKSTYVHASLRMKSSKRSFEIDDDVNLPPAFSQPFDDLFIWSVLTQRHDMSLLLWPHGQGGLAKSLVAVKLNRYLATEISASERSDINLASELEQYAEKWEDLSYDLLDTCFRQNARMARQLLTMELEHWSNQTCLTLAVNANHQRFLGHRCCQILLADLWLGALNINSNLTLKVLAGILIPPSCLLWDYKSTEELQLLPHDEKVEVAKGKHFVEDVESVMTQISQKLRDPNFDLNPLSSHPHVHGGRRGFQNKSDSDEEGGKSETESLYNRSKAMEDDVDQMIVLEEREQAIDPFRFRVAPERINEGLSGVVTTTQELSLWNKFWEFHRAPVTKFYRHTLGYIVFVCMLAYVILNPVDPRKPRISEMYVIAFMVTLGMDTFREFIEIDASTLTQKWIEFQFQRWQLLDFLVIIIFMGGVALRFTEQFEHGLIIYRVSSIYWNLRLYKYMGVHRFIGPKLVMMSRMIKHMLYFAIIIFVIIMAFGLARESIRFPGQTPSWKNMMDAVLEPYVMMFGEVDTDSLSPQCGEEYQPPCPVGYWIVPIIWAMYMMTSNILLVNVLIAVFNGIYSEIDEYATELWMFQRFRFVMEYEQKPSLPNPFIIFSHLYSMCTYIWNICSRCLIEEELQAALDDDGPRIIMGNEHRLKTFLNPAEQTRIFDFEEDNLACMTQGSITTTLDLMNGKPKEVEMNIERKVLGYSSGPATSKEVNNTIAMNTKMIKEIYAEMDTQKEKLDKILTYWERTMEESNATEGEDFIGRSVLNIDGQSQTMR